MNIRSMDWWLGRTEEQQERKRQAVANWKTTRETRQADRKLSRWAVRLSWLITIPLVGFVVGGIVGLVVGIIMVTR